MSRRSTDPTSIAEIGARLALTRRALGFYQVDMSRLMGAASNGQAWGNYEAGTRRISIDHALMLCRNCGLTLDWIYQGQMVNLPPTLREHIQRLMLEDAGNPVQPLTRRLKSARK